MAISDEQVHQFAQKVATCGFEEVAYKAVRILEKDPDYGKIRALKIVTDNVPSNVKQGNELRDEAAKMLGILR